MDKHHNTKTPQRPPSSVEIVDAGVMHGGAWKVAYADFVTAMMAFFLLLWLLNVTTQEEKNAISNYWDPTAPQVSQSESGAGGVMGGLSMSPKGSMATNIQPITPPRPSPRVPNSSTKNPQQKAIEKAKEQLRQQEKAKFKKAEQDLKQAIQDDTELAALSKNLIVDMTPEGLRIQIVDQDGKPMFASGSARMFEKTKKLMTKIAKIADKMPNELSIRGHTDSVPYGSGASYTNWELSSDRANASRRVLIDAGIPADRVNNVVGKADTEHLLKDDPTNARNRRISIVLLKEELTNAADFESDAKTLADEKDYASEFEGQGETGNGGNATPQVPVGTFRKSPGAVQFP